MSGSMDHINMYYQRCIFSSTNLRGINILEIDPINCSLVNASSFDAGFSSAAALQLSNYLQNVSVGTVLIGVTSDSSTGYVSTALNALSTLGVSVGDVQNGAGFAFVAQVGYRYKTVMNKSLTRFDAAPKLNVLLFGRLSCAQF
jgi:hypothetical protein